MSLITFLCLVVCVPVFIACLPIFVTLILGRSSSVEESRKSALLIILTSFAWAITLFFWLSTGFHGKGVIFLAPAYLTYRLFFKATTHTMQQPHPSLSLIVALAKDRAIGRGNRLLWSLPADMAHFREATKGATVIMGRKTWESLPPKFRPLPGRHNIVISRQTEYVAEGAVLVHSLNDAVAEARRKDAPIFVIGGAEIYAQALPLADRLVLTEVDDIVADADAFFPTVPATEWQEVERKKGGDAAAAVGTPAFDFVTLVRR
jgi:dihydrofolate reductase